MNKLTQHDFTLWKRKVLMEFVFRQFGIKMRLATTDINHRLILLKPTTSGNETF